jgi:hypothetical protein
VASVDSQRSDLCNEFWKASPDNKLIFKYFGPKLVDTGSDIWGLDLKIS